MAISETSIEIMCSKCGIEKPYTDFHVRKDLKSGHSSICKECIKLQKRIRRKEHPEISKEQHRIYYQKNREKCLLNHRLWKEKNKDYCVLKNKERYIKNKTNQRDQKLQIAYKITLLEYNELFIIQNGKCAICGKHQTEFKKAMGVDHNHNTGEIRGLLCSCCNRALGLFSDNIERLKSAIRYMEK